MPTTALTTKLRALLAQIGPMGLNGAVEKKLAKFFVAKDADPVSVAHALVDLALESPSQNVRWTVGWLAGPVLVRALGPGEHLDPRVDALMGLIGPLDELAAIYQRIPDERRKRIWEREFGFWQGDRNDADAGNPFSLKRPWADHLVERFTTHTLKHCPEAAPFIERYWSAHPRKQPKPRERRLFAPKKADAPYVFADPVIVDASDWDDFDPIKRKQLLLAVARMTGKKVKSPSGIARALDAEMEGEFEVRSWDVYRAKHAQQGKARPAFDCWVFRVDNAVFFEHGTLERVQVYVLQDSFMGESGKPSEMLAADLEASAPESLWAT